MVVVDEWKVLVVGSIYVCVIINGLCGDVEGICFFEGMLFCWGSNGVG